MEKLATKHQPAIDVKGNNARTVTITSIDGFLWLLEESTLIGSRKKNKDSKKKHQSTKCQRGQSNDAPWEL